MELSITISSAFESCQKANFCSCQRCRPECGQTTTRQEADGRNFQMTFKLVLARRCRHQVAAASWIYQVTIDHFVSDGPLLHTEEHLAVKAAPEHPGSWSGPTSKKRIPQHLHYTPCRAVTNCHASSEHDHQEKVPTNAGNTCSCTSNADRTMECHRLKPIK